MTKEKSGSGWYWPHSLELGNAEATRWYILIFFSMVSGFQSNTWFTFSSVPNQVEEYYNLNESSSGKVNPVIDLLLNWGPICFLPTTPFAAYLLSYPFSGLKNTVRIAVTLAFFGNVIRLIPTILSYHFLPFFQDYQVSANFWQCIVFLHIGQILNAIAGPLVMGPPTKLSVLWFPNSQRSTATGIAAGANTFGNCFGYLLGPALVKKGGDLPKLLWVEFFMVLLPFICIWAYFPMAPEKLPTHASRAALIALPPDRDVSRTTADKSNSEIERERESERDNMNGINNINSSMQFSVNTPSIDDYDNDNDNENSNYNSNYNANEISDRHAKNREHESMAAARITSPTDASDINATESGIMSPANDNKNTRRFNEPLLKDINTNASQSGNSNNSSSGDPCDSEFTSEIKLRIPATGVDGDGNGGNGVNGGQDELLSSDIIDHLNTLSQLSLISHLKHFAIEMKQLFTNYSALLVIIAGGMASGIFAAWGSLLQDLLKPMGLSTTAIGVVGFLFALMAMVGTLIIGPIADKYFVKRLRLLIYYVFFLFIVILIIAVFVLPSPFSHNKSLIIIDDNTSYGAKCVIVSVIAVLLGTLEGALVPLFLELAAEVSYPVSEGSSATLNVFVNNIAALVFIGIGTWINTYWETLLVLGVICFCLFLLTLIKEQYKRVQ